MKNLLLSVIAIATISLSSLGQAPEGFKYQAVVRNASNTILINQAVGLRMTIQQDSIGGTPVYQETFATTTNAYGLVNLEIGTGTVVSGTFTNIDWSAGPYFMETAVDVTGGTSYTVMGTSQLMSVPYALYAKTSGNSQGPQGPQGVPGPVGANGAAGQGGVTQAGLGILVIGTGTSNDPYIVSSKNYTIGLWPELGGYVFKISADGRHGLVAETQNQSPSCTWYLAQDAISNPLNHSTNGQKFMDWRLPTKYELNEMYLQNIAIGAFGNVYYWSSTEVDATNAWEQNFNVGSQTSLIKSSVHYVRAVRTF
jgi:hypothetical protein